MSTDSHTAYKDSKKDSAVKTDGQFIRGLKRISLELTLGCNLRCVHCYAGSDPYQFKRDVLSTDEYRKVIEDARVLGCAQVQFIGGEPTLNRDLFSLVAHARGQGYAFIEVYTNATRITSEMIQALKANKACIAFSCYSTSPEIHDAITKVEGSHSSTLRNVRTLIQEGIPVRAGIISMEQNHSTVEETVQYLKSIGVRHVGVDRARGVGRGRISSLQTQFDELCHNCWRGSVVISSEGNAYPCIMAREFQVGDIRKMTLKEIVESDALAKFRQASYQKYNDKNIGCRPECTPDQCNPCDPSGCEPSEPCEPCGPNSSDCQPCVPF